MLSVSASVRTVSQSNGFVALNDWQQQQQRLSDVGAAVGRLLLRLFPLCLLAAHWQFVSFSLFLKYSDITLHILFRQEMDWIGSVLIEH